MDGERGALDGRSTGRTCRGVLGVMAEVGARPHWRDALVLVTLAVVILGGLVHYSSRLGGADRPAAGAGATEGATSTGTEPQAPSSQATAQLEGAPPTDPSAPTPLTAGTCWDGRETTSLRLCGLPEGARGLAWVFPSFERDRGLCHRAEPNDDSYPVQESYECFQRVRGQPITVTYDEVRDPAQVDQWLVARVGADHRHRLPGAHGGRSVFTDGVNRPARITGTYARFPYVVSVYAATPRAAARAWEALVQLRPSQTIRGTAAA